MTTTKKPVLDSSASIIAGLVGLAGALGLLSRWGVTIDEAAAIVGFGGMVIAGIRAWIERSREYETRKAIFLALDRKSIEELEEHIELRKLREVPRPPEPEPPEAA